MNTIALSITTMTLGVMIGITGTHYQQVNRLVEQGAPERNVPVVQPLENVPYYQHSPYEKPVTMASSDVMAPTRPAVPMMVETSSYKDDALLEYLVAMRKEQAALRKQLAETNRDVSELTFQVDTHSDSFKPLNSGSVRPRTVDTVSPAMDGGAGVLPPKQ